MLQMAIVDHRWDNQVSRKQDHHWIPTTTITISVVSYHDGVGEGNGEGQILVRCTVIYGKAATSRLVSLYTKRSEFKDRQLL